MDIFTAIDIASKLDVLLSGYLISEVPGELYLCSNFLESYPPQCSEPSLRVVGIDLEKIGPLHKLEGTIWTANTVSLRGNLKDGVFHAIQP